VKRYVLVLLAAVAAFLAYVPVAGAETRTVRYGPFTIPAGTMDSPGETGNRLRFAVKRPCSDCFITKFTPDLVDEGGNTVNMDQGPMLHHAVWTSQWRPDATCGNQWLGLAGERFFASGNERSVVRFPDGYGYRVRWYDSWNLLVELMNHSTTEKTVYVKVNFDIRPSWASVRAVRPVWLDIDQCGDSQYAIPPYHTHRAWTVNVPGKVVSAIGHVHGHGKAVEATYGPDPEQPIYSICRSEAMPMDSHDIETMTPCVGDLGTLSAGQTVQLHSEYNEMAPALNNVMGIMLMYVRPQ